MDESISYPTGRFTPPADYTPASRADAIDRIARLPAEVREAVRNLDAGQLRTPYREGGWTIAQVVHHLADAHVNGYVRVKLALTEDQPVFKPYDQTRWAETPEATATQIEDSLIIIDGLQSRWADLLRRLTPDDFSRAAIHPERGPQAVDRTVALYAWHGRHHTSQITGLRTRRGW